MATPDRADNPDPTIEAKVGFLSSLPDRKDALGRIIETRMSWVFLYQDRVLKLKKPIRNTVLDFATPSSRERAVRDELRLNRRLAPGTYLAVRTLCVDETGTMALDGKGRVVDWLLEMRRLPEDRNLSTMIETSRVARSDIHRVCTTLAAFYADLPPAGVSATDYVSQFETEHQKTARVITDPKIGFDGATVDLALSGFEAALSVAQPMLLKRAEAGRIVEGHGDLRPEHVFLTDPVAIIDCLDFNRALRSVDPFDEIAFLGLECMRIGAKWVFEALYDNLCAALNDCPPAEVIEFYWRYRALLRARLCLSHLTDPVIRTPEKWRPLAAKYLSLSEQMPFRPRPQEGR